MLGMNGLGEDMDLGVNQLKRSDSLGGHMKMIGSSPDTYNSGPPPTPAKDTYSRTGRSSPSPSSDAGGASKTSRYEEDFEQLAVLGKGSFGTCFKSVKRLDGCVYAVKRTNRRIRGDIDRNHVLKEVYALSSLCNAEETPHVVRYFSAWIEDGHLYIQNELCECNLADLAKRGKQFGEKQYLELLRQVLKGVHHMHSCNMVHLDIKVSGALSALSHLLTSFFPPLSLHVPETISTSAAGEYLRKEFGRRRTYIQTGGSGAGDFSGYVWRCGRRRLSVPAAGAAPG
jgi:wee1-like protein kinase